MNFNNFTIKSQEAIQKAVEIARTAGNQAIEPIHLLKGVMTGRITHQFPILQGRRELRDLDATD